jgi:hypothetical protein
MNALSSSSLLLASPERTEDTRFVSPTQFCELLVSRRNLLRSDDRGAKLRGLIDPIIGVRFLVHEEELAKLAQ